MKYKLQQVLSDKSIVDNTLKQLGLGDHILASEGINKLRKSAFLFSDETAVPVHDKAHIIAAYKILEQIEDCEEEVEQAKQVLDGKFKRMFSANDLTVEDALKLLLPSQTQDPADTSTTQPKIEINYSEIARHVVDMLKDHTKVDDSYLYQRNQTLEREIEEIEADYTKLRDMYRISIVDQVLSIEGRLEDTDYRQRLNKRSLESLADKLDDLRNQTTKKEADQEDTSNKSEDTQIADKELSIDDAVEKDGDIEDGSEGASEETEAEGEQKAKLSVGQFHDEYKKVLMDKGLFAASQYLKQLKEEGRVPDEINV